MRSGRQQAVNGALAVVRGAMAVLVLAATLWGQVDIPVNSRAFYVDLGRSETWGASGAGGVNNQWIYSPVVPDEGTCLSVWNNNPTSSHTFVANAYATLDQTIGTYQNLIGTSLASRWVQLAVYGPGGTSLSQSGVSSSTITVGPSSSVVLYFRTGGAARIAVQITGSTSQSGTPDTADLLLSRGIDSGVCGNTTIQPQTSANCSNSVVTTLPVGSQVTIVNASPGAAIHVCSLVLNASSGSTEVGFYSNASPQITGLIPVANGALDPIETSYGQLFQTSVGAALEAQSVNAAVIVTVTYAVF